MSQHAITEVAQIGCASAEIWIAGPIVRCDLQGKCCAPRPIDDLATIDQCERRRCEIIVFEQRNLERENCFSLIVPDLAHKRGEICMGGCECIDEGLVLLRRRSALTGIMFRRSQTHKRSQRYPGSSGPAFDAMSSSMRPIVHPGNLHRRASRAPPAQPSHQSPPRENRSSNPSAPSSPSP